MEWIKQIVRYLIIMCIQVLLIGNLQLWGMCHPYLYVMCLLIMPITLPMWTDMLIGMVIGFIMDSFTNSPGVHMAACILIMYLRRIIIPQFVFEAARIHGEISSLTIGQINFIKYTIILTIIHHSMVLILSAWSLRHFWFTLCSIIISSIISISVFIGYDIVRNKQ